MDKDITNSPCHSIIMDVCLNILYIETASIHCRYYQTAFIAFFQLVCIATTNSAKLILHFSKAHTV